MRKPQLTGCKSPAGCLHHKLPSAGDLPLDVVEDKIREVFSTYGHIECVDILRKEVNVGEQYTLPIAIIAAAISWCRYGDLRLRRF